MKLQRIHRSALIGVVVGVVAAGLFTAPSGQAASTIKIGYINATIGPFAGPAPEITKGINIALKEFKSQINGKKIVIIEEASDATAALALEKAKKLVEKDKVDIVFGPLSGDEGVAIANYGLALALDPSHPAAREFMAFHMGPQAREVFLSAGFTVFGASPPTN